MKRILASILCMAMVLSMMSFSALAQTPVDTQRAINVVVNDNEVFAEEEVVVSIVIKGNDLANAKWTLQYNTAHFELQGATNTTGVIEGYDYITSGGVYADGDVLATYTFKAKAQAEETVSNFLISDTYAYTYLESIQGIDIAASNNERVPVTIKLRPYTIHVKVDGQVTNETALEFPYDDATHTFEVVADPAATVTYKVNGEEKTSVAVKSEGTYTIEYTITPALGYAEVKETFTLTIAKPAYEVEVNLAAVDAADYVSGKKIVLVYTNANNVFFTYNNAAMIDVTARGYKYNNQTAYAHVFAFVTESIQNGTIADYKALVKHSYTLEPDKITLYDEDLNFTGNLDIRDITTAYGVYNGYADYYADVQYQKNILKADTNGDKCVEGHDLNAVVNAVYPEN